MQAGESLGKNRGLEMGDMFGEGGRRGWDSILPFGGLERTNAMEFKIWCV